MKDLESLPMGDNYLENKMGVSPLKDLKSSPIADYLLGRLDVNKSRKGLKLLAYRQRPRRILIEDKFRKELIANFSPCE